MTAVTTKSPIHGDVFRLKSGGVIVIVGLGVDIDRRNRMIKAAAALGVTATGWVSARDYDSSGRYWPDHEVRPPRPANWETWDLNELIGFVREDSATVERLCTEYVVEWAHKRRRDLQLQMRGEH